MSFGEGDQPVQTLPTHRADQSLTKGEALAIRPIDQGGMPESSRRPWRSPLAPDAHRVRRPLPPGTESPGPSGSAHCAGTSRITWCGPSRRLPRAAERAPALLSSSRVTVRSNFWIVQGAEMFDATFFREQLPQEISRKGKEGIDQPTVIVRLDSGVSYNVASLGEISGGWIVLEVYPERGTTRRHNAADRKAAPRSSTLIVSSSPTSTSLWSSSRLNDNHRARRLDSDFAMRAAHDRGIVKTFAVCSDAAMSQPSTRPTLYDRSSTKPGIRDPWLTKPSSSCGPA